MGGIKVNQLYIIDNKNEVNGKICHFEKGNEKIKFFFPSEGVKTDIYSDIFIEKYTLLTHLRYEFRVGIYYKKEPTCRQSFTIPINTIKKDGGIALIVSLDEWDDIYLVIFENWDGAIAVFTQKANNEQIKIYYSNKKHDGRPFLLKRS